MARDTHDQSALQELATLRRYRQRRGRDLELASTIERLQAQLESAHRKLGNVIDAWNRLVPDPIAAHSRITALRGGILQVSVDSAAISYELDRLLREGLLDGLRREYRGTLRRVRVQVAPPEADEGRPGR